jgi:hypothetical protein
VDGVSGQSLFPHQRGNGAQKIMAKRHSGLKYTLCGIAVKCPDAFVPLFYHGSRCVIVLVSSGLWLVTYAKRIGSRFHRKINGHIAAAS